MRRLTALRNVRLPANQRCDSPNKTGHYTKHSLAPRSVARARKRKGTNFSSDFLFFFLFFGKARLSPSADRFFSVD